MEDATGPQQVLQNRPANVQVTVALSVGAVWGDYDAPGDGEGFFLYGPEHHPSGLGLSGLSSTLEDKTFTPKVAGRYLVICIVTETGGDQVTLSGLFEIASAYGAEALPAPREGGQYTDQTGWSRSIEQHLRRLQQVLGGRMAVMAINGTGGAVVAGDLAQVTDYARFSGAAADGDAMSAHLTDIVAQTGTANGTQVAIGDASIGVWLGTVANAATGMLMLRGYFPLDTSGWTAENDPVYISDTATLVKDVGSFPRQVGYCLQKAASTMATGTAGMVWFDGAPDTYAAETHNATQLQGYAVHTDAPTDGQVMAWDNGNSRWDPTTLVHNATQLQGSAVHTDAPTDGQALVWDNGNSRWDPTTLVHNATQLQGRTVHTDAPTDTQVLAWDNGNSRWAPATPSAAGDGVGVGDWAYTGATPVLAEWPDASGYGGDQALATRDTVDVNGTIIRMVLTDALQGQGVVHTTDTPATDFVYAMRLAVAFPAADSPGGVDLNNASRFQTCFAFLNGVTDVDTDNWFGGGLFSDLQETADYAFGPMSGVTATDYWDSDANPGANMRIEFWRGTTYDIFLERTGTDLDVYYALPGQLPSFMYRYAGVIATAGRLAVRVNSESAGELPRVYMLAFKSLAAVPGY